MRSTRAFLFIIASGLLLCGPAAEARINLFSPLQPGVDTLIGPVNSYKTSVAFVAGKDFFEVPFQLTYVADPKFETGGQIGLRGVSGATGISDMLIGTKYEFWQQMGERPAIIGEAAFVLPTADYSRRIGQGAVGLSLYWAMVKKIEQADGFFGLGVTLSGKNSDGARAGNVFNYHFGAAWPWKPGWQLSGEIKGFNHGSGDRPDGTDIPPFQELYLAPGLIYDAGCDRTGRAALLIGLTGESSTIGFHGSITF